MKKSSDNQTYLPWEKDLEGLGRDQIRELQLERLQLTCNRAYSRVDFYRKRFDEIGLVPEDIKDLADLDKFPFTTQEDLANHYPYGMFAVPLKDIVRLKYSRSVGDSPIVIGYTKKDVKIWTQLMARLMGQIGIERRDIVQIAFNYSLFTGAFNFNAGTEEIGATVAPSATVSATIQLRIMQDFRSTVLATTPSFALHILKTMQDQSLDPHLLHLRTGIFGPDFMNSELRTELENGFEIKAYSVYGVEELVEPGVAGECEYQDGLHIAEDHFYTEIINPATGKLLPPGTPGELVITTLTTEAYPLIRYRTGNITSLSEAPCQCGRKTIRMRPSFRRSDDRISVRGVSIYPQQIEKIILEIEPSVADFRLVVHTIHGLGDRLDLLIVPPVDTSLMRGNRGQILERIRSTMRRNLGLGVRVQWSNKEMLPAEGMLYKTVIN